MGRLGKLARTKTHESILELCEAYSLEKNEIYFDRDPHMFNSILNFYRTGKLHVLEGMCIIDFANELDFWMIKEVMIDTCRNDKFIAKKEHSLKEMQKAKDLEKAEEEEVEDFGDGYFSGAQEKLWNLFEKPQSSLMAKWLSLWSILLVLISTTCMCINTFPWMQP